MSVKHSQADKQMMAEHHDTATWLQQQADCFEQQQVPDWDRESTFDMPQRTPWWKSLQFAPALSMAMSTAAIFMVLFNVQVSVKDGGMMVSFADSEQQQRELIRQELAVEFEQKLQDFSRDQQVIMANYVADIQAKQQEDVTHLASYLISASRQERKEEIGALVNYFKEQRSEDLTLTQQQLNQVIYQLNQQNSKGFSGNGASIRRASFQLDDKASGVRTPSNETDPKLKLSDEEEK